MLTFFSVVTINVTSDVTNKVTFTILQLDKWLKMGNQSWITNSELGFSKFINSPFGREYAKNDENLKPSKEIIKPSTVLINAEELAKSYISEKKTSSVLQDSQIFNDNALTRELGRFALANGKKKQTVSRIFKAVFQENLNTEDIPTLLKIAADIGLDTAELEKNLNRIA